MNSPLEIDRAEYYADPPVPVRAIPPPPEDVIPAPEFSKGVNPVFWALFTFVLVFQVMGNYWWLRLDNHVIYLDEEVHMATAREFYEAFRSTEYSGVMQRLIAASEVRPGAPVHPPLLHLAGAVMLSIFGYSTEVIAHTNTVFFLLALLGVYRLARLFMEPWHALFALFVVSLIPLMYGASRFFMTDYPAMTLTVWAVYALARSRYFTNTFWVFVFAVLLGLGILARTNTFIYYFLPAGLLFAIGLWHGISRRRWASLRRLVFHAVMIMVVSVGIFAPWYFHHIGYLNTFWTKVHLGGALGGPLVDFEEPETPASPAPVPDVPPAAAEAEADSPGWTAHPAIQRFVQPLVPWRQYPVHVINNAMFLPLAVLALLGMVALPLVHRRRAGIPLLMIVVVVGSWVLMTYFMKFSNPRYTLPVLPFLGIFAAGAVCALPWVLPRRILMAILGVVLVVQYVHLSFRQMLPSERLEIPAVVDPQAQKIFHDPGIAVYKNELIVSLAFSPITRPTQQNFHQRLFEAMIAAEKQQVNPMGEYAYFQRLNVFGMDFAQVHFWPGANPYRDRDLKEEDLPLRRLMSVGLATTPEGLLPEIRRTEYIVYAIEKGQEAQAATWPGFFSAQGFREIARFDMPRLGRAPTTTYGVVQRQAIGETVELSAQAIQAMEDKYALHDLMQAPSFAMAPAELQDLARERFASLLPGTPFILNEALTLEAADIVPTQGDYFELRMIFRVTQKVERAWRAYVHLTPRDLSVLPDEKRNQGYIDQNFDPYPAINTWSPGEYVVLRHGFQVPPSSYWLRVGFFQPPAEPFGRAAELGWVPFDSVAK